MSSTAFSPIEIGDMCNDNNFSVCSCRILVGWLFGVVVAEMNEQTIVFFLADFGGRIYSMGFFFFILLFFPFESTLSRNYSDSIECEWCGDEYIFSNALQTREQCNHFERKCLFEMNTNENKNKKTENKKNSMKVYHKF